MNETKKLADKILRKTAQDSRPVKSSDFAEYARLDKFSVMELKDLLKDYGEFELLMPTGVWRAFIINDKGRSFVAKGGYDGTGRAEQERMRKEEKDEKAKDATIQSAKTGWIVIILTIIGIAISIIALFKE